ncbi:MAG: hypothetical protein KC619_05735, partial [Myxococcales bacterium]|nr:hypothetical protein [Myxococcales bacterium]
IGFRTGAEYTPATGWRTIWEPRRDGSVTMTPSEPGTVTVTAGASGGVGYLAKLYDVAGPGIALSPGATGTFEADGCEYSADLTAGLDLNLNARLDIPAFDYTLAEYTATQSLLSATIAETSGVFPIAACTDAGPMDPDAGTPTGTDAGTPTGTDAGTPTGTDGGAPADGGSSATCGAASGCQACNEIDGCGYCESTGECMNDSQAGSCPGGTSAWKDGLAECRDCSSYGDCTSCLGDAFCGWCGGGGGCMTAEVGGAGPDTCSGGWVYTSTSLCM